MGRFVHQLQPCVLD